MYYTVYKITNTINRKYYIGKHQTLDINDEYMGSGQLIKNAIKKYGKENFIKEILFVYDNEYEMNEKEKELVSISKETYNVSLGGQGGCIVLYKEHELYEQTCKKIKDAAILRREETSKRAKELHSQKKIGMYNKKQSDFQKKKVSEVHKNKIITEEQKNKQKNTLRILFETEGYVHFNTGKKKTTNHIEKILETKRSLGYFESHNNPMYGKKHSEETLKKLSDKAKNRIKVLCEYCNQYMAKTNYIRWHGDKCKLK